MSKQQTLATPNPAGELRDDTPGLPRARGNNPAERACMSCGETFLSEGWHNRLCRRCAKRSQPEGIYAAG